MRNDLHTPDLPEVMTRERCYVTELKNDADTPEVSVARCRVEPGITTERHSLSVLEWYVILSGEGRLSIGDAPIRRVGAGDAVMIPAGVAQRIENTGNEHLVFFCVCVPRFTPECYRALE
jgi:mannose-6-phosphate isomerase-like protein (cupin superfamily)